MDLKPVPQDGIDPYLAPFGRWKIVSISTVPSSNDLTIHYRCVDCRSVSIEKSDVCPNCKRQMVYKEDESIEPD